MKKLQIFICENFYPEYQAALQREGINDVNLSIFPSLCDSKKEKSEVTKIFSKAKKEQSVLICSRSCDALKLINEEIITETISSNYCFSNLISDEFLNYLIAQGNYIISTVWLKKWKSHLANMGFDKETARMFFKETSKQIVFLDAKIYDNAEDSLKELSSYLDLPYLIVPINLKIIQLLLKSKVYEWRLHNQKQENTGVINELRSQCADYAAVFDILGEISSYTNRRDVIGKVKDLFMMVFGVQKFKFWSGNSKLMPSELRDFKSNDDNYLMLKNENRFCIKVSWNDHLYGVLDASAFLFSKYIERYLNLALDISKFLGLVLYNNEQYEKIVKSENKLKYISFHDSMTGLYNRNYLNQLLTNKVDNEVKIIFMFDIDKLKYVNDNFGHIEGDKLIKSFADILNQCFRKEDIVIKIGGDEFTAFLYDGDEKTAKSIKNRILNLIDRYNEKLEKKHLKLSVSIGYVINQNNNETIEDFMKKADNLMYRDKMRKD